VLWCKYQDNRDVLLMSLTPQSISWFTRDSIMVVVGIKTDRLLESHCYRLSAKMHA
jgi:hypothetical protein